MMTIKTIEYAVRRVRARLAVFSGAVLTLMLLGGITGCDTEDDYLDHTPPEGKGSLVVENNTAISLTVFFDGERQDNVDDFDHETMDLDPGLHRVVLMENHDGSRSWSGDVDVLEGRLTVLHVEARQGQPSDYDVSVTYHRP